MDTFKAFLENLRPRQWTKNLILFAAVIFAQKLGEPACLTRAFLGAVVFCLASGAVYVYNDMIDRDLDRLHPYKKLRPIPSGRLPLAWAARGCAILVGICLLSGWLLGEAFLGMVALFFLWNWLYTRWLKLVPVLDVMGIGMSFVIRATAGVMVLLPACPGATQQACLSSALWLSLEGLRCSRQRCHVEYANRRIVVALISVSASADEHMHVPSRLLCGLIPQ